MIKWLYVQKILLVFKKGEKQFSVILQNKNTTKTYHRTMWVWRGFTRSSDSNPWLKASYMGLLRSRSSQAWSTLKARDFTASPVSDCQINVWPQIKMLFQTWFSLNLLIDKMSAGLFYHMKINISLKSVEISPILRRLSFKNIFLAFKSLWSIRLE